MFICIIFIVQENLSLSTFSCCLYYFLFAKLVSQVVPSLLLFFFKLCFKDLLFYLMCLQVVYTPGQQDKCFLCGQVGHLAANCEGKAKRKAGEFDEKGDAIVPKKPYQVDINSCNIWFHKKSRRIH